MLGDRRSLVSSHDMLLGVHKNRTSQNFIVCPSYLMLQVFQPCIFLRIIHSSQIQKCTVIDLGVPEIHTTRWLASVLIVFLKRLADFMKKMTFCTIPAWTKCSFLHRNPKLVILTRHLKPCINHWKYEEAMIWFLTRNSWFFVKSRKSTLRTHSWEDVERIRGGVGVTLGSNKISKQSPQSCNKSNSGVIPKALGW